VYYSAAKTGYGGWRNHALWFLMDIFLFMIGIFLIFGPDTTYNSGTDGWIQTDNIPISTNYGSPYFTGFYLSPGAGPRSAIIGLQLAVQASLGIFAIYAANAYASLVFGIFGIFNVLCLMGSNFLFNYNEPIWLLSQAECFEYFRINEALQDLQRCHGDGYLEFLRVVGTIGIIVEAYLIIISMLAYATAVPAAHYGVPGAVPAAGPVANTGYPAQPYAATTTTAGTYGTTTGPVVTTAQPTYTTGTAQPYSTTTTTTQHVQ
jgi:hypothetical protein